MQEHIRAILMASMQEHEHTIRGLLWSSAGLIGGLASWFLHNIQAINGVMQFAVLCASFLSLVIGLRKIMRAK